MPARMLSKCVRGALQPLVWAALGLALLAFVACGDAPKPKPEPVYRCNEPQRAAWILQCLDKYPATHADDGDGPGDSCAEMASGIFCDYYPPGKPLPEWNCPLRCWEQL